MMDRVHPNDCPCGPHDANRLVDFVHSFPRPAAAFVLTEVAGRYVATGTHTMALGGLLTVMHAMLVDALATPAACECAACASQRARARRAFAAIVTDAVEGRPH